jgi:hypothetical protein
MKYKTPPVEVDDVLGNEALRIPCQELRTTGEVLSISRQILVRAKADPVVETVCGLNRAIRDAISLYRCTLPMRRRSCCRASPPS